MSKSGVTRHTDQRPYLTVITWPPEKCRAGMAAKLARATGFDERTIHMRLAKPPPMILGQFEPDAAKRAVTAITEKGGDAFAPTFDDLAALGPTNVIRDMRIDRGKLHCEMWRGGNITLDRTDVHILIRATLRSQKKKSPPARGHPVARVLNTRVRGATITGYGGLGLALAFGAPYSEDLSKPIPPAPKTSDRLDIHTHDGRIFQINADRFTFHVLGDMRVQNDRLNMDTLCDLLSHITPDEIVDPYFQLWKPPVGYHRLRVPQANLNRDDPAFAFYSRWAALMYRHVLKHA